MPSVTQERITKLDRKIHILRGLISSRSHLSLQVPDVQDMLGSILLDITDQHMIFDDVVSPQSISPIKVGTEFTVHTKLKGVPVSFDSQILHVARHKGGSLHVCNIPDLVIYSQKRDGYRISLLTLDDHLRFEISGTPHEARVHDLSDSGARILTAPDIALSVGQTLSTCQLNVGNLSLPLGCEIRHIREDHRRGKLAVGVHFLDLDLKERRKLRNFLFSLEREKLREDQNDDPVDQQTTLNA
ncbi:MAG: PilZ domain-containing protein [Pseudomonadota bacterium]